MGGKETKRGKETKGRREPKGRRETKGGREPKEGRLVVPQAALVFKRPLPLEKNKQALARRKNITLSYWFLRLLRHSLLSQ